MVQGKGRQFPGRANGLIIYLVIKSYVFFAKNPENIRKGFTVAVLASSFAKRAICPSNPFVFKRVEIARNSKKVP